jgi:chromosome segregation ATPase
MAPTTQPAVDTANATGGSGKTQTLEEIARKQELYLEDARLKSKASSDGLALIKKGIAETQQLVDAYGKAYEDYSRNFNELKLLSKQQAKLIEGLSQEGTKVDEATKNYDDSTEEIKKRIGELEKQIPTLTAKSVSLVQEREEASQDLDKEKTRQKEIDQNLKSLKAIREDVAAKEIKGEYVQMQFLLKRYKDLIVKTEGLLITKEEFGGNLRAAWQKLYDANQKIQDSQTELGNAQAELKKTKEDLKQRQEARDKTILESLKDSKV